MSTPYYQDAAVTLHLGDSLNILPTLPDSSIDAVICDPPYELRFMGRKWDASGIAYSVELWSECLRVLKPGGHLAAFGGTRTYHRMTCAIEDAGFEIRDSLHWIYGSGFPKGIDVSKAIDKAAGAQREVIGSKVGQPGYSLAENAPGGRAAYGEFTDAQKECAVTAPATDDAARWEGWNTSLRPSHEPIVLARKPLTGTVAANVLEYGTGAINIGACRVNPGQLVPGGGGFKGGATSRHEGWRRPSHIDGYATATQVEGRWPANVLLSHLSLLDDDGQPVGDACADGCVDGCAVREMDQQSGVTVSRTASRGERHGVVYGNGKGPTGPDTVRGHDDTGGASRFFPVFRYQAKAPARERPRLPDGTSHPTVKPQALMAWLCRLLTPPGGTVLDPFAGSGTTLEAARAEGFRAVGIEQNPPYADLCRIRLTRPAAPATPVEPGEQHDRADDTLFTLPTAGESGRPHP